MRRHDALLVVLSFAPLLVKAVDYATLGSYVPLFVFGFFFLLVGLGARTGPRACRVSLRIWASALVLWGLVRLGLIGLFRWVDIGEAHPINQVTPWYFALSVGHLALGFYLFRAAARRRAASLGPGEVVFSMH